MARNKDDNWVRTFAVSDPRRHKKGFTIYKVTSVVFPKNIPEAASRVVVWKRYSEFKKLHRELKTKHQKLHLKDTFPSFAKAKFFGRFEDEVIEERRQCAVNLLEFIGKSSVLFTSNIVVKFFESGHVVEEDDQQMSVDLLLPSEVQIVVTGESPSDSCDAGATSGLVEGTQVPEARPDVPALALGGTWQFPQASDNISLSSHSSDDRTTFTDTDSAVSGVSSPLQVVDLQFFDPLAKDDSEVGVLSSPEMVGHHTAVSNSVLLSTELKSPSETSSELHTKSDCVSVRTQDFSAAAGQCDDETGYSQVTEGLLSSDVFLPSADNSPSAGHQDVNYIFEAAYHVGRAQQYEANEDYEAAFAFYKAGVACLLSGVQDDPDPKRKQAVKVRTTRYLLQAERIYNQHLALKTSNKIVQAEMKQQELLTARLRSPTSQLLHPTEELSSYKVLGVISKVLLVLHSLDDRCYVMKVVHKSPCPVGPDKRTILPQNVPFMVPLYKYYETESGIFLVLKHASGGKLWDHVGSYFQSLPQTPAHARDKEVNQAAKNLSTEADAGTPNKPPPSPTDQDDSYLELIQDYKSCKNSEANVEQGRDDGALKVTQSLKMLTPISGSKESLHQMAPSLPDVGSVKSAPRSVIPDLLPRQWDDATDDIPTTDLVAKAQRLLESVSKTLHVSETVANLASEEHPDKQDVKPANIESLSIVVSSRADVSPKIGRRRERPRSASRKLGRRFSRERRYSSDDLFEGRGRASSGSLECFQAKVEQLQPRLPEATVRVWAAEMLVAIETLHRWGIVCRDLNPDNVLLGDGGHVFLTYHGQWASVDCILRREAVDSLYAAPEVRGIFPLTPAVDWWSYGALLFELLTSKSLYYCHPGGIHSHTILSVPECVSDEARHLLTELLRFDPSERLGSGMNGTQELKSHPFFSSVNWDSILDVGIACS